VEITHFLRQRLFVNVPITNEDEVSDYQKLVQIRRLHC